MSFMMRKEEAEWKPHPFAKGVKIKPLLTKEGQGADITCMLVLAEKSLEIPGHTHDQDDILYILSGEAEMWVDGIGSFKLTEGTFVRVLKKTRHKIYNITKDVLAYDVFSPALM
jgi:quercetin dioxygenase-like cupin family protein